MYVHIGGEEAVYCREIIAIFDLENTSTSYITREFLRKKEKAGEVVTVSDELPKSVVLTEKYVYITPVTVQTLEKRFAQLGQEERKRNYAGRKV